jgi:Tol biopolymer transport system component
MPEIEEVFRMATQKVRQDPGALDRQVTKQRRAVRNRRLGVFATVLILVAAIVTAFALTRGDTREVPANGATTSTAPGSGSSMVDIVTGETTPLPANIASAGTYYAVSPDHATIAYSACCTSPDPLFVANIDGTAVRQISANGWDAFGAQWSPDGSLLVYQQRDASTYQLGNLVVQDIGTGRRTRLTNLDQTQLWGWWFTFPSFAPNGRSILFHLPRGDSVHTKWDLWSVPVAGGKQTLVRRNAGWGGYSPDGKRLAYLSPVDASDFRGGALWISRVDGGTPRALVPEGLLTWLKWSPDGTRISYSDAGAIRVVDVATGSVTMVARGGTAEWFDDHTLIVGPGG